MRDFWPFAVAAIVVAWTFGAFVGEQRAAITIPPHIIVVPLKVKCEPLTPAEYRDELVQAAESVGWTCGPKGWSRCRSEP